MVLTMSEGLAVDTPLKVYGTRDFRAALGEVLDLALTGVGCIVTRAGRPCLYAAPVTSAAIAPLLAKLEAAGRIVATPARELRSGQRAGNGISSAINNALAHGTATIVERYEVPILVLLPYDLAYRAGLAGAQIEPLTGGRPNEAG